MNERIIKPEYTPADLAGVLFTGLGGIVGEDKLDFMNIF